MAQVAQRDTRERTVTRSDGRTVSYAVYGPAGGRPVLCCHGTPGSRLFGRLLVDQARDRSVRLLVPDRPGYGRSDPVADHTSARVADDHRAVLDDTGVDQADVIAFSGGACYALALASSTPGRVGSVTLVSGAVPPSCRGEVPRQQRLLAAMACYTPRVLGALLAGQRWVATRGRSSVVVAQYTGDGGESTPDAVAEAVRAEFCEAVRSRRGVVRESRRLAEQWPFDPVDVEVPVWLIHGSNDGNVPLSGARTLSQRLPDARLTVVDGADHLGTLVACREDVLEAA